MPRNGKTRWDSPINLQPLSTALLMLGRAHASANALCCQPGQHVAMQLSSTDELDAAIDWLWAEPKLRDLPRVNVDQNTMFVPAAAIEQFRQQGKRAATRSQV